MKKIITYSSLLIIGAFALVYGIQNYNYLKSKKVPASFKTIQPARGDNFRKQDTISSYHIQQSPRVNMFAVRIFKDSIQLTGTLAETGVFTVIDSTRIRFTTTQNQILDILTGLPNNMHLQNINSGKGSIRSDYHTSFRGSDEYFQLTSNKYLDIGYIWRTTPLPNIFTGPNGISIQQSPIYPLPLRDSMIYSPVSIVTDSGTLNIKTGVTKTFTQGGTRFSVFIQTSVYQKTKDAGQDNLSGYVLHAIIVQE